MLFNVLQNLQVQPRWEDIPLPPGKPIVCRLRFSSLWSLLPCWLALTTDICIGRSLNSCRQAFENVRISNSGPMGASMAPLTPTPLPGPMQALKRPYPFEAAYSGGPTAGGSTGREIRPKPSNTSAVPMQASPIDPPTKKKRGRPTKAEALAKAEAAAASGTPFGEPGPVSMSRPASQNTPQLQPLTMVAPAPRIEEPKPGLPPALQPVTRMPIAAMLTPTAGESHSASQSQSGSSSGRRRRARSTKSEPGGESPLRRGNNETGYDYESPYARPDAPDTPARAAVLRHREENIPRTMPTPGLASQTLRHSDTEGQH